MESVHAMDTPVIVQMEQMCRACMGRIQENSNGSTKLQSLFDFVDIKQDAEDTIQRIQLSHLLEIMIQQLPKIEMFDELPKNICTDCIDKLLAFKKFENCCIRTDLQIRKLLDDEMKKNSASQLDVPLIKNILKQEIEDSEIEDLNQLTQDHGSLNAVVNGANNNTEEMELVIKNEFDELAGYPIEDESLNDVVEEINGDDQVLVEEQKNREVWRCKNCSKEFLYRYAFVKHLAFTRNNSCKKKKKRLKCFFCKATFAGKENIQRHMKKIHNIDTRDSIPSSEEYKCEICKLSFTLKDRLQKHTSEAHSKNARNLGSEAQKPESVDQASAEFTVKFLENESDETNILKIKKTKEEIDKAFVEKLIEDSYVRGKNDTDGGPDCKLKKDYKCDLCIHTFKVRKSLLNHLLVKHGVDVRFQTHQAFSNEQNQRIKCDICGEIFEEFSSLVIHKVQHAGEKQYNCEYCDRSFFYQDHLRLHLRIHNGEKPYVCKYCPKKYIAKLSFIRHLSRHLGKKVHECNLCPRAFCSARKLRSHFAKHKHDDEKTKQRNKRALLNAQKKLELKIAQKEASLSTVTHKS